MARNLRCPVNKRGTDDLEGCGSTNLQGPDEEGLYDCLDCGLWFTEEAAEEVDDVA